MNCQEVKKLMPVYLDKELEPQESQLVKDHLAGCPACQNELEIFERSWAMLDTLEDLPPDPGFVGRFWTRLSTEQSWHEKWLEGIQEKWLNKQLVPVLVTACVFVIVGSFVMNNYIHMQRTGKAATGLSEEDQVIVENVELVENLDVIEEIDFLEDLDVIEDLDILEMYSRKRIHTRYSNTTA